MLPGAQLVICYLIVGAKKLLDRYFILGLLLNFTYQELFFHDLNAINKLDSLLIKDQLSVTGPKVAKFLDR